MKPNTRAVLSTVIAIVMLLVISCACRDESPVATRTTVSTNGSSVVAYTSEPTNGSSATARTPIPTVVEPGLAYGIPCKPPCWRGLIPGQSTRQDVVQAMEQARADGWADHIIDGSSVRGGYSVSPSPFTGKGTIDVTLEDDIVTRIDGNTLLFYHPVGTLVEQFGRPEWLYLVDRGSTTCISCEDWEPGEPMPNVPVHLLYPSQGLYFLVLVPSSGLGCICPEMKVASFCYYAPTTLQNALTTNHLAVAQDDLVEWHGFGGGY